MLTIRCDLEAAVTPSEIGYVYKTLKNSYHNVVLGITGFSSDFNKGTFMSFIEFI